MTNQWATLRVGFPPVNTVKSSFQPGPAPGNWTCNRGRGFFHLAAPWVSLSDEKVLRLIVTASHFTGCSLWQSTEWVTFSVRKAPFSHLLIPFLLIASLFPPSLHIYCNASGDFMLFFEVLSSSLLSLSPRKTYSHRIVEALHQNDLYHQLWCSNVECTLFRVFVASSHLSSLHLSPLWPVQTVLLVCISIITVPMLALCWGQSLEQREEHRVFFYCCFSRSWSLSLNRKCAGRCLPWREQYGRRQAASLLWIWL